MNPGERLRSEQVIAPDNVTEIQALEADRGRYLGSVRVVGRRRPESHPQEPILTIPTAYTRHPLLRGGE